MDGTSLLALHFQLNDTSASTIYSDFQGKRRKEKTDLDALLCQKGVCISQDRLGIVGVRIFFLPLSRNMGFNSCQNNYHNLQANFPHAKWRKRKGENKG